VTPAPRATPAPSRNQRSTPPSSVLPSSPAIAPNTLFSRPSESTISSVVRRVQIGLQAYGYYHGALDGVVGKETRAALVRFQTDFKLNVTGTITPEVLDAFKIQAE
jgi:His-Xaa-Ser repeat protein HxsA